MEVKEYLVIYPFGPLRELFPLGVTPGQLRLLGLGIFGGVM